jgi:hypothetical protein
MPEPVIVAPAPPAPPVSPAVDAGGRVDHTPEPVKSVQAAPDPAPVSKPAVPAAVAAPASKAAFTLIELCFRFM